MADQRAEYIYDVYVQLPGNDKENLWTQVGFECQGIADALHRLNDYALDNHESLHMLPMDHQGGVAYNMAVLEAIENNAMGTDAEFIFSWFSDIPVKFVINRKILV